MPADDWAKLVCDHFDDPSITAYFEEIIRRAGELESDEQVQLVIGPAMEIWNATPQADRGGLTASELSQLARLRRDQ